MVNLPKLEGYMIYNPKTELFSKGGIDPSWKKQGKIWSKLGHLKNHLIQSCIVKKYGHYINGEYVNDKFIKVNLLSYDGKNNYKDCVIINVATGQVVSDVLSLLKELVANQQKNYYLNNCEVKFFEGDKICSVKF